MGSWVHELVAQGFVVEDFLSPDSDEKGSWVHEFMGSSAQGFVAEDFLTRTLMSGSWVHVVE
jgi:hypothetical protein